jgi:hypothetical protein
MTYVNIIEIIQAKDFENGLNSLSYFLIMAIMAAVSLYGRIL